MKIEPRTRIALAGGVFVLAVGVFLWSRTDGSGPPEAYAASFASHLESHGIQPVRPFRDGGVLEGAGGPGTLEPGDLERVSKHRTTPYRRRSDVFEGDPELAFEWRDAGMDGLFVDYVHWTADGEAALPDFLGIPGVGIAVRGEGRMRIETRLEGVQCALLREGDLLEHFEKETVRRALAEDEGLTVAVEVWRAAKISIDLEVERSASGDVDLSALETTLKSQASYEGGQGQALVASDRIFAFRPVWVFGGRDEDLSEEQAVQVAEELEEADVDARARRGLIIAYPRLAQIGLLIQYSRAKWDALTLGREVASLEVEVDVQRDLAQARGAEVEDLREETREASLALRDTERQLAAANSSMQDLETDLMRTSARLETERLKVADFEMRTALAVDKARRESEELKELFELELRRKEDSIQLLLGLEGTAAGIRRRHAGLKRDVEGFHGRIREEIDPELTLEEWIEFEEEIFEDLERGSLRDAYKSFRPTLLEYASLDELVKRLPR